MGGRREFILILLVLDCVNVKVRLGFGGGRISEYGWLALMVVADLTDVIVGLVASIVAVQADELDEERF